MNEINPELYPDVLEQGSLVSAMTAAAREHGLDLGSVCSQSEVAPGLLTTAEVDSSRGRFMVWLGGQSRTFFVGIQERRFIWAEGATDSLNALVAAAAAWRDGMRVGDFAKKFPFMTLTRLARDREAGNSIPAQWNWLLTADTFEEERPMVKIVHSDGRFTALFPNLSHGTLRLSTNLGVQGAREIHICPLDEGLYRVEDTQQAGSRSTASSLTEAVEIAARFLSRDPKEA
ncbi:DUF6193 family natural product biosynthesis protein [Streptomyces rhizosphaericola]|uniref:DUF6193 family natural product biosynthesis protein n=1 Tax=Streptomyces rhizosphaericola TaxID=2564098 RepID=UPI0039F0364B